MQTCEDKWRSMDTAPDDQHILAYCIRPGWHPCITIIHRGKDGRWWDDGQIRQPTHWQPLPLPPQRSGDPQ